MYSSIIGHYDVLEYSHELGLSTDSALVQLFYKIFTEVIAQKAISSVKVD